MLRLSLITLILLGVLLHQSSAYSLLRMDNHVSRSLEPRDDTLCPLGSVQSEMVFASYPGGSISNTFPSTRLSADQEPDASLCLFVSAPLSSVTLSLSITVFDGTALPTSFTVTISQNGEPASSQTLLVTTSTVFGPIFFAPPPDAVPSLDISNQTFSISVTPENPGAGSSWDLSLSAGLSLVYWPSVVATLVSYPDFNGLALGLPLPVPLTSANKTDTALTRQLKYSFDFANPLPFDAVLSPCLTVSGPGCTPVPAGTCVSTGLATSTSLKKGLKSFSSTFLVKNTNLGATGCPADGLQLRLLPALPGLYTDDVLIQTAYNLRSLKNQPSGMSTGAIIGIAAGVAVALIVVIILGVYIYRRKQHSDYQEF